MTWVLGLTAAAGHIDAGIARAHLSLALLTSIDGRLARPGLIETS
jgi:hypothetical protein